MRRRIEGSRNLPGPSLDATPIRGVAAIRLRVYGCCGEPNTLAVGPSSTMRPCCITYTRSAIAADDVEIVRHE